MAINRGNPLLSRRNFLLAGAAATAGTVPFLGCGTKDTGSRKGEEPLVVGGLPVTCNLTLPISCTAREAAKKAGAASGSLFEYSKYSGWPELKESLMSGDIQAAYMLAPLVMDLADKKVPVKIVSIGHRSGAEIQQES